MHSVLGAASTRTPAVTHFGARGPKEPPEPWRRAAVGAAGAQWKSGGAARRLEPRKFSMRPRGTQGEGGSQISNAPSGHPGERGASILKKQLLGLTPETTQPTQGVAEESLPNRDVYPSRYK